MWRVRFWFARRIVLDRKEYVNGIADDGSIIYILGPLRAWLFGVRVPILWAIDQLTMIGILKFPTSSLWQDLR